MDKNNIIKLRSVEDKSHLASVIKKVVVILSAPRSGSSLLANVLSKHPEIASLTGETETFLL